MNQRHTNCLTHAKAQWLIAEYMIIIVGFYDKADGWLAIEDECWWYGYDNDGAAADSIHAINRLPATE